MQACEHGGMEACRRVVVKYRIRRCRRVGVQVCERVDVEAWRREGVCAHVRQGLEAVSKVWRQSTRSGGGGKVWRWRQSVGRVIIPDVV